MQILNELYDVLVITQTIAIMEHCFSAYIMLYYIMMCMASLRLHLLIFYIH